MPLGDYLLAALVAVLAGLDRTAALQIMVSRPVVIAPLTGWLLGDAMAGLQVGALVELLWLGRLPVGAAIPPDDTQVAIGATTLAIAAGEAFGLQGLPFSILCTLTAMPLGKVGQFFDRLARHGNGKLQLRADAALVEKRLKSVEFLHLWGLLHFALASVGTYAVIVLAGTQVLQLLIPVAYGTVAEASTWLQLAFPLVGTAVILATINVRRSRTLFSASFVSALLVLWLL